MFHMRTVAIETFRNPEQWTKMLSTEEIAICHLILSVLLDVRNVHFVKL
jgi:hypothetical protein